MEKFLEAVARNLGEAVGANKPFSLPQFIGGVVTALLATWIF